MRKLGEPSGLREKVLEVLRTTSERRASRIFDRHLATRFRKSEFDRVLRRMVADGLITVTVRREFDGVYNRAFPGGGTSAIRHRRYLALTEEGAR